MKKILSVLPFLLASLIIVAFWRFQTLPNNYAWNPKGKEMLMLDIALTSIFFYKVIFWLIVTNLSILVILQLKRRYYKTAIGITIFTISFYFICGCYINRKCAYDYYVVFINQSVAEEYINRPILEAGYQIGAILTEKISNREMKYRRYAIYGIEEIKYKPAIPTLAKILFDSSELDVFRADALKVLKTFDTEETRGIVSIYLQQEVDDYDSKVIKKTEYYNDNK